MYFALPKKEMNTLLGNVMLLEIPSIQMEFLVFNCAIIRFFLFRCPIDKCFQLCIRYIIIWPVVAIAFSNCNAVLR